VPTVVVLFRPSRSPVAAGGRKSSAGSGSYVDVAKKTQAVREGLKAKQVQKNVGDMKG